MISVLTNSKLRLLIVALALFLALWPVVAVSRTDSFETYLMYLPYSASGTSIWVTIGKLTWLWGGSVTEPRQLQAGDPCTVTTTPSGPSGSASSELPTWSNDFAKYATTIN